MRQVLKWPVLSLLVLALTMAGMVLSVRAQDAAEEVSDPIHQIKLSDAQVKNFIAAQPDLAKATENLQDGAGEMDTELESKLAAIAKKHGFKDLTELDDVTANVMLVMTGLDPETGEFMEPSEALKKEIAAVEADKTLPKDEKEERLDYLKEALSAIGPLKYKENVAVVKANREELEKALQ